LCGPIKKQDGRANGKRQHGGQPWVKEDVEHFLILDVEHHILTPPQHKVDPNFQSLCCGLGGNDLLIFSRNSTFLRKPIRSCFPNIDGIRNRKSVKCQEDCNKKEKSQTSSLLMLLLLPPPSPKNDMKKNYPNFHHFDA